MLSKAQVKYLQGRFSCKRTYLLRTSRKRSWQCGHGVAYDSRHGFCAAHCVDDGFLHCLHRGCE